MTLEFSVAGTVDPSANSIVYLSGQNSPVTVPISAVNSTAGLTSFIASFPFQSGFSNGLTIAALVKGTGQTYTSSDDVAADTLYGPGLVEVD